MQGGRLPRAVYTSAGQHMAEGRGHCAPSVVRGRGPFLTPAGTTDRVPPAKVTV